ncbi:MAG TPA: response regulator [Caldithrix abyssi]|uniref:Response regulator n=1 Tax=Caldithrix abyssi TaxID=187145 RepID=A0A7V5UFP6_CALAY|nr:response regulator [Caldithrix abyssi]
MAKEYDILAIDDEQVILDSIVKICALEGWSVDTAPDAKIALKKMEQHRYKLFISDIMMPEMDGFEFLEYVNRRELQSPVIMTTGFSTVENAVKSLYNGAIDFLPKPFTMEELQSCISRAMRYREIKLKIREQNVPSENDTVLFVPCPAKYTRLGYHSWMVLEEAGTVKIGVTDLFLETIGFVQEIHLFEPDNETVQGNSCATILTKDGMEHTLLAPLSGSIVQNNESVLAHPEIIEKDPYFKGWLYTLIPSDLDYESKFLIPCTSEDM